MIKAVLGIDGGGTKTVSVVADLDERFISIGKSKGSNPNYISRQHCYDAVYESIANAFRDIPSTTELEVLSVCLGIAGVSSKKKI